jgi:hypothetical protein
MTASELKYHVENEGSNPHFFTRKTMQFFGDRMANYGVRSATVRTDEWIGNEHTGRVIEVECWELYRRRPVKHGLMSSTYFSKATYKRVYPKEGA